MKIIKFFLRLTLTRKSAIIIGLSVFSIIVGYQIRFLEKSSVGIEEFFYQISDQAVAKPYSNSKLSSENLEIQSCGAKVSAQAFFELVVLKRFNELSNDCFENYERDFGSLKLDKVIRDKSLENIDGSILRDQSFTSIFRLLNKDRVSQSVLDQDQIKFFTETNFKDKKIDENFISDMLSASSHFKANHKGNEIHLKLYLFHQLPFDLKELEVTLDDVIIPTSISSDSQLLDFKSKKKNKKIKILFPKSFTVETTPLTAPGKFEILPTTFDLTINLEDTKKIPFIQSVTMNGKIANKKVKTKLNTGINVAEHEAFDVCSDLAGFEKEWMKISAKGNTLVVDKKSKIITLKSNTYKIKSNLYFPCDYSLVIEAGSKFFLDKDVSLFFTNSVRMVGTESNKISINATDENQKWGALIFLPNSQPNTFNKIKIHNFSASNGSGSFGFGRFFSGMLSILGASVDINNLFLSDNGDDDLLNIINSNIDIENIEFHNAFADGLDCDWCEGKIHSIKVNRAGVNGDGLDFSYSTVDIEDAEVYNIGDKGISVGERSNVNIKNLKVENAIIGVASKDSSNVYLNGGRFVKVEIPLTTYIKKLIFSEPTLLANDVKYSLSGNNFAAKNTTLTVRN